MSKVTSKTQYISSTDCLMEATVPGHLQSLKLTKAKFKNLEVGFHWNDIPMLSILTGRNGCGKTASLQLILNRFKLESRDGYPREDIARPELVFGPDLQIEKVQIAYFSSAEGSITATDVGELSLYQYRVVNKSHLSDFLNYEKSAQYNVRYELKFPELKQFYDTVIQSLDVKTLLGAQNPPYISYSSVIQDELQRLFSQQYTKHVQTLLKLETYLDETIRDLHTLQEYNKYLLNKQFKYTLMWNSERESISDILSDVSQIGTANSALSSSTQGTTDDEEDSGFDAESGISNGIRIHDLSPGERLHLLSLAWMFNNNNGSALFKHPQILLLDEPDAHLHPILVRELIQTIKSKLVDEYRIQVILVTHNPTTVSLAPSGSQIYNVSNTGIVSVSKKKAVRFLTPASVTVNLSFRIVWVEAPNDIKFYKACYAKTQEIIEDDLDISIQFRTFGNRPPNPKERKRKIEDPDADNSSRQRVIDLVKKFSCNEDQDRSLEDFIFGIIDRDSNDGENINIKRETYNIKILARYAIENYLYDPVNIVLALKSQDRNISLLQDIETLLIESGETLPPNLEAIFKKDAFFQKVIDATSNIFRRKLQDIVTLVHQHFGQLLEMSDKGLSEKTKRKKDGTGETMDPKGEINRSVGDTEFTATYNALFEKLDPTSQCLLKNFTQKNGCRALISLVRRLRISNIIDGDYLLSQEYRDVIVNASKDVKLTVKYPQFILDMRGHDLQAVYLGLEPSLQVAKMLEIWENNTVAFEDLASLFHDLISPHSSDMVTP